MTKQKIKVGAVVRVIEKEMLEEYCLFEKGEVGTLVSYALNGSPWVQSFTPSCGNGAWATQIDNLEEIKPPRKQKYPEIWLTSGAKELFIIVYPNGETWWYSDLFGGCWCATERRNKKTKRTGTFIAEIK